MSCACVVCVFTTMLKPSGGYTHFILPDNDIHRNKLQDNIKYLEPFEKRKLINFTDATLKKERYD